MAADITVLSVAQRGTVWISSLTKARYRWSGTCWEVQQERFGEWFPAYPSPPEFPIDKDITAYPTETFKAA